MSSAQYQRTISALQNDTLDAIAYRVYANRSVEMLPQLIESNADYTPNAVLKAGSIILLPSDSARSTAPSIKLWD